MNIKILIKKVFNFFGLQIVKSPHKGLDICQDIIHFLPNTSIDTIFDVGANIGQSVETYQNWFPSAMIYCFEPVQSAFEKLELNTSGKTNITCLMIALGAEESLGSVKVDSKLTVMSKVSTETSETLHEPDRKDIFIRTIDSFCKENSISNINYLKTDTEGFDLEVLKGAKNMLINSNIDIVEVEVGTYPGNEWHIPLETIKRFMEGYGYLLFGIYDQTYEWTKHSPNLRRINAAFISSKVG